MEVNPDGNSPHSQANALPSSPIEPHSLSRAVLSVAMEPYSVPMGPDRPGNSVPSVANLPPSLPMAVNSDRNGVSLPAHSPSMDRSSVPLAVVAIGDRRSELNQKGIGDSLPSSPGSATVLSPLMAPDASRFLVDVEC
jgi:hypothetical protein